MERLCPAVTALEKVFGPLCTKGQGSLWAWAPNLDSSCRDGCRKHKARPPGDQKAVTELLGPRDGGVCWDSIAGERGEGCPRARAHLSSCAAEPGGGTRDAEGLCFLPRVRRESRTAGREGTGVSQRLCSAITHCTHSTFPPALGRQSPLSSAATAASTLRRPCAIPRTLKSSSGGRFRLKPVPRPPAGKASRVSTRTKERSAALQ